MKSSQVGGPILYDQILVAHTGMSLDPGCCAPKCEGGVLTRPLVGHLLSSCAPSSCCSSPPRWAWLEGASRSRTLCSMALCRGKNPAAMQSAQDHETILILFQIITFVVRLEVTSV